MEMKFFGKGSEKKVEAGEAKKQPKKKWMLILYYLLIAVIVACVVILAVWKIRRVRANAMLEETKAQVNILGEVEDTAGGEPKDESDLDIDFDALYEINEDIYAWIYVPGTDISYPVLQSGDDKEEDYYLNHNLDGSTGRPACIYTQKRNSQDFTDPNTVIYGHNMHDGTMFRTLHEFEDAAFFAEHPYFYIYTPEGKITYHIFAAYRSDNSDILEKYNDFQSEDVFVGYLAEIMSQENSVCNLNSDVEVTAENTIVTLSTCIGDSSYRYLVQGVRED
ncbi:MAG: class B sortase [Clostridiales bacterium]|nr:class B sortase [Clostridiales bacterium]